MFNGHKKTASGFLLLFALLSDVGGQTVFAYPTTKPAGRSPAIQLFPQ
jgi:hypothetical protein